MTFFPVVLVIGPSGVGKSELSDWVAEDLQFLHLDIDQGGLDTNHLRREWEQFSSQLDPEPLATVLHERIVAARCLGAVLSLPSTRVLSREHIDCARSVGILTALLWGPKELCKKAARERPKEPVWNGKRYDKSNKGAFDTYGSSDYDDLRVEAFRTDGSRWPRQHMVAMFHKLVAG